MTILEACFSPALGGLELYCLNTANQLEQRGHRVFLWLDRDSRMSRHPLAEQLNAQCFPSPGYFDPFFCRKVNHSIHANGIDIVHLHRSRDLASFSLLKKVPKVLTLQIESSFRKRDLYHRFVYSRVDRILTITERMRSLVLKALPVKPDRVSALHYGVDANGLCEMADNRATTRSKWDIPADALVIGLIGRLEPSKGQNVLLEAFSGICRDFPQAHVLLVGEPPPEESGYDQELKNLTRELEISERVHFSGFQSDTASVYAALDICVLASHKESFGLVLLEAMALGVPLIATEAGGVPEIVRDGESALLIPPQDPEALASALVQLIRHPDLRRRLADNGGNVVRSKFSLEGHLNSLETHFEEVIEARRRIAS